MRLAEHALYCYRLRYERPVRWSDIVEDAAPFVLLRLQSDTGHVGVAEITVKPTWCGVTARSLITTIEEMFLPLLATAELDDPTRVRALLDRIPENQAAKTLIDNACWDLYAARVGRPPWQQWGGGGRGELSWALTRQAPPAMAAEAAAMVARHGFRTLQGSGGQGFGAAWLRDPALFIERGAKALSIKPGRFGLSNARAMNALAREAECAPVVGLMGESVLGTLASLQFAAMLNSPLPAELTWYLAM